MVEAHGGTRSAEEEGNHGPPHQRRESDMKISATGGGALVLDRGEAPTMRKGEEMQRDVR